ncbi:STM4015 family protein [Streptomyces sp. 5-8]|uniref:STM4015 family protein n=1 Tax=Streptomyces musisoli TaxID=2802280 RepID=A0ABS1NW14_9ACTN|nr:MULTISPECIES: STM4015 family protein [Streptomyces]MBL1104299.1 STM4015 family protein [Streptomyces musisoli]MBY8844456.1 STM4015 family protein [Streptomyces sp. SP2-10]
MTIGDHLHVFHRLPVHPFPGPDERRDLPEPDGYAWRVSVDVYETEEEWTAAFARFLETVDTTRVRALVVGAWGEAYDSDSGPVIESLLAARDRLPALRAVFLGDMVMEESEISWIQQTDVTPLLTGFPDLAELGVRGGSDLLFPALRHTGLRRLTIEAGGLPAEVVRGVGASDLPALEHLDLWLGTPDYGGDSQVADLEPVLSGDRLPRLRHLALRNSEIQDAVAAAVASAPVVARLETLDLSMGVLTDEGAAALLGGQPLTHLKKLDLHHHYISEPLQDRIRQTLEPAGVEVDLDRGDADDDHGADRRYVAVGE